MKQLTSISIALFCFGCISVPPEAVVSSAGEDVDAAIDSPSDDAGRTRADDMRGGVRDLGPVEDAAAGEMGGPDDGGSSRRDMNAALSGEVHLVVGEATALSAAETDLKSWLESAGLTVSPTSDENAAEVVGAGVDLVIVTRTASSGIVAATLRSLEAPLIHWEYALQWSDYLGTVTAPSTAPAVAQSPDASISILSNAPAGLTCGRQGEVSLYGTAGFGITFAEDAMLGADAIRVATSSADAARVVYYAYEAQSTLADGTVAAGDRIYFGIDRDSWQQTSEATRGLLRCAISWALLR